MSCDLIRSFLFKRSQFVIANGNMSNIRDLHYGVPQGSILGPLLCMLYVNDLRDCIYNSKFSIYADDIQLFTSSSSGLVADCIN
ncbi:reverse transcriptase domain-containing protein, partial [Escherichia coli]